MRKFTIYNLQFTILIAILAFAFYIVHSTLYIDPASAQIAGCTPQTSNPRVQEGLISTPNISTNFSNPTGTCIVDPAKAPFAPFKIPSYDDLKSIYFTQSKTTKTPSAGTNVSPITLSDDGKVFNYTAPDVNINGTYNYNGTAVIFIDGNINIGGNIRSLDPNKGLVMVVKNNVNIDPGVSRIDAVIISSGTIYTAGAGCSNTNYVSTANPLIINGSLISLDSSKQINFCRILSSTSQAAAEQINEQPKYLVILRNLYANTFQKWSEITAEAMVTQTTTGSATPTTPTPTLPPATPTPTPTPTTPTPSPSPTVTPTPRPLGPDPIYTMTGFVFVDKNNNGIFDWYFSGGNEQCFDGTVVISSNGVFDGSRAFKIEPDCSTYDTKYGLGWSGWKFQDVEQGGPYTVTISSIPTGWSLTTPSQITVPWVPPNRDNLNFGLISLTPTPAPILTNGDFFNQLSNWNCTGDKSGICVVSSSTFYSGPYSALINNTGGGWGWQIQQRGISASSNQQFCLSARIKKNSANDMAGVALQEGGSPWREVDILAPNQTGWQMLRQTVQVGSNWILPVQVFARVWNKDGAVWFDDITLTSGACQ